VKAAGRSRGGERGLLGRVFSLKGLVLLGGVGYLYVAQRQLLAALVLKPVALLVKAPPPPRLSPRPATARPPRRAASILRPSLACALDPRPSAACPSHAQAVWAVAIKPILRKFISRPGGAYSGGGGELPGGY